MNAKIKKKGKRKIIIWSTLGAVAAALMIAVVFFQKGSSDFQEEKAQIGDITTYYRFSGQVEAKNRKIITSETVMQIEEMNVNEGDQVKNGDVLIKTKQGEKIKAPIDGEVSKVFVEENAELMSGAQLIEVVDYSVLQSKVKVDEYDLKFLEVGKEVNVTINALEKEIKGTISAISKEATNENGVSYFIATIDLANDDTLRVGMSAEAKILKEEAKGVTTLPVKVIQFDSKNKPYVLLPSEKSLPTKKYITTGINDGMTIEVKSGIKAGEFVMFTDNEKLKAAANMHGGME